MGRSRVKFHEDYYPYFLTCSIVDGIALFDDPQLAEEVLEAIRYIQTAFNVTVYGFVLMPNHLHMIAESKDLSNKIRKFKSYTARRIIDSLTTRTRTILLKRIEKSRVTRKVESNYQVWQEGSYPKQIDSIKKMIGYLEYIHHNPVKAGFVELPEHWRYSSARTYQGLQSLYPVKVFEG